MQVDILGKIDRKFYNFQVKLTQKVVVNKSSSEKMTVSRS